MSLKKVGEVKKDRGFRLFDLIVYGVIVLFVAVTFIVVFTTRDVNPLGGIRVYADDKTVFEYDFKSEPVYDKEKVELAEDNGNLILTVRAGGGYNKIVIDKDKKTVKVTDADCGKKDCVYTPAIKNNSGIIYCSPHRLRIVPYNFDPDNGKIN